MTGLIAIKQVEQHDYSLPSRQRSRLLTFVHSTFNANSHTLRPKTYTMASNKSQTVYAYTDLISQNGEQLPSPILEMHVPELCVLISCDQQATSGTNFGHLKMPSPNQCIARDKHLAALGAGQCPSTLAVVATTLRRRRVLVRLRRAGKDTRVKAPNRDVDSERTIQLTDEAWRVVSTCSSQTRDTRVL